MISLTFWTGIVLIGLGVAAYVLTAFASVTALIPAVIGVLLLVAGLIGRNPRAYRIASYAALVVGLLGVLGSAANAARIGEVFAGTAGRPSAIITSAIMLILLVAYLIAGISLLMRERSRRRTSTAHSR